LIETKMKLFSHLLEYDFYLVPNGMFSYLEYHQQTVILDKRSK
jgi:hypothetical protein